MQAEKEDATQAESLDAICGPSQAKKKPANGRLLIAEHSSGVS